MTSLIYFVYFVNLLGSKHSVSENDPLADALVLSIRKTCPCNTYPLKSHFYIAKLGFAGVYLFFLFSLQNIDCGYSLEPPR